MARTKQAIKNEISVAFMANETLANTYGFAAGTSFESEFSIVSFENIIIEIIALAIFIHELIFDRHKAEVENTLHTQKSGREPWYRTKALEFQYGFDLVTDMDYYDNTGYTEEQVELSKVIKYAAVDEAEESSRVIIKIAGETEGILAPITEEQRAAFEAYIQEVKWAGVKCTIINFLPDKLYLSIEIKYDPLVLNATGLSILNGTYPVNNAIAEYMKELPFDGELRLSHLVDKLQGVEGVLDATILNAQSSWIVDGGGYGDPVPINIAKKPESGYFEVVTFDNITYVV